MSTTVDLDIEGMTCSSCVAHVQGRLNALDGVTASVNLATETARVVSEHPVSVDVLIEAVRQAGYTARPRGTKSPSGPERHPHVAPVVGARVPKSSATDSHEHLAAPLRARFWVAASLSLPVLLISMLPAIQFPGWAYLAAVLTTPVVWWAGWPFHRAAVAQARHGRASMDTLVSLGVMAAWLWSLWALVFGEAGGSASMTGSFFTPAGTPGGHVYFESAAVIVTLIVLGRLIEARSRRRAGAALSALGRLLPDTVRRVELSALDHADLLQPTRRERTVRLAEVRPGDLLLVRVGERVPADGVVETGEGFVDESVLTGESAPRPVKPAQPVTAGAIVLDAVLTIQVTQVGSDTRLARLTALVESAQIQKSATQQFADRVSGFFVPIVLALGGLTAVAWLVAGSSLATALGVALSVIIIACPCALGLATPVAILAGTGRGAQRGVVIVNPDALAAARRLGTVFLDKTGTLTEGEPSVAEFRVADGVEAQRAFGALAALEAKSTHPLARAILAAATERGISVPHATDVTELSGTGVRGVVLGVHYRVGRPSSGGDVPAELAELAATPASSVMLWAEDRPVLVATFTDRAKPDAAAAVAEMRRLGLRTVIASGDREAVVRAEALRLGIDEYHAEQTPEQKIALIDSARARGAVAMVGDGINDAAALARADLGIAMASGSDLAQAAADIVVTRSDARVIVDALRLGRAITTGIRQNLAWAFGYNVVAVPLAVAGLLNPMIAAAAMAASSLFVVLNSARLARWR